MTASSESPRPTAARRGLLLLFSAAAIALTGCGGSSGAGSSGLGYSSLDPGGHAEAARAIPSAGSVTQSSVTSNGVTAKSVTTVIEQDDDGNLVPKVSSEGWGFENLPVDDLPGSETSLQINGNTWQTLEQSRTYGDGSKRWVRTYTDATPGSLDDDYLVMGYWLRVPSKWVDPDGGLTDDYNLADFMKEIEYGVFVNGGDPYEQNNILALTGTATYTGDATALYADSAGILSGLVGDVEVVADFGDGTSLGTVSGTVDSFERLSGGPAEPGELDDSELAALSVTLGQTNIGSTDSGFFTGDTSMTFDGSTFSGKWGGQFYGNGANPTDAPESVAGTFGATTDAGDKVIIGTYAADR